MGALTVSFLEMFLKFQLRAKHSLDEREEAHEHIWRIEVGVTGEIQQGRIASMPHLRAVLEPAVSALQGKFLNADPLLDPDTRAFPTCEHLAYYFEAEFKKRLTTENIAVRLTQIQVFVDELSGEETGSAKLTFSRD